MRYKKWRDLTIFSKTSLFFYKNKSLGFGEKFKNELRRKPWTCCPAKHKNNVSRLAFAKIITEHQNRACRLVQLSRFNITKFLMTTSYLLTIHWTIKFLFLQQDHENRSFFCSEFLLCNYSDLKKNREKIRTNQGKYT